MKIPKIMDDIDERFDGRQQDDKLRRKLSSGPGRLWAGLFLLLVGGVLLLDQMGFPLPDWLFSWHILMIAIGLFLGLRHNFRGGAWLILILIGGCYLIQDFYPRTELRRFIAPCVLIFIGFIIMFRPRNRWRQHPWRDDWRHHIKAQMKGKMQQQWHDGYNRWTPPGTTGGPVGGPNGPGGPNAGGPHGPGNAPGGGPNGPGGAPGRSPYDPGAPVSGQTNPGAPASGQTSPGPNTGNTGPIAGANAEPNADPYTGSTAGAGDPGYQPNPGQTSSKSDSSGGVFTTQGGYTSEDYIDTTSIFGGVHKKVVSKNFKGGDIVTFLGGSEIDLSQADIIGTARLDVTQVMGGTKIIVPAHWEVRSEVTALFAGFEDKRQQPAMINPQKVLIIDGTSIFGGIELKNY